MSLHLLFFTGALAFLSGILYASLGLPFVYAFVPATFLFAAFYSFRIRAEFSLLAAVLLLAGSFYYFQDTMRHRTDMAHASIFQTTPNGFLFQMRERVRATYEQVLPAEKAALLFGMMMGNHENFSDQLLHDLTASGLRFLIAIDGLHMVIMITIISGILRYFMPGRFAFFITWAFITFFVALTGFTVSGIRAAAMGFVAGGAKELGRRYEPRNALLLIAVIVTLFNPKILISDIGFQLSFLAVISILYVKPVFAWLFGFDDHPGFLNLKDSFLIALSVQLATAPIVISQFHTFSATAFAASVFAVMILPYVLGLGFLMALTSFIFFPVARVLGFAISPFLDYILFIITIGARFAVPFNPAISPLIIVVYYAIFIGALFFLYPRSMKTL